MKAASQLFYLAVFSLLNTSIAGSEQLAQNNLPESNHACAVRLPSISLPLTNTR